MSTEFFANNVRAVRHYAQGGPLITIYDVGTGGIGEDGEPIPCDSVTVSWKGFVNVVLQMMCLVAAEEGRDYEFRYDAKHPILRTGMRDTE